MIFNEKIALITKHGKEEAIAPPLSSIGLSVDVINLDTDVLGTFSGKIKRKDSVIETLRKKIKLYKESNYRFYLASEGSFISDLLPINIESLIVYDSLLDIELITHTSSYEVAFYESEYSSFDDFKKDISLFKFPSHSLLVKASDAEFYPDERFNCLEMIKKEFEKKSKLIIRNDLRADANPTRMKNIFACAQKLIEAINEKCPKCSNYGFGNSEYIAGLSCSECLTPTHLTKFEKKSCPHCQFELIKEFNNYASPEFCQKCNP